MTMLHAAEVLQRHPHGCWVFDATGRRLDYVLACDPETGEVLRFVSWNSVTHYWMWALVKAPRWAKPWLPRLIRGWGGATRHGFWPAPLRLVPKSPEVSP